jgi:signal transduction histidine kinase
LERSIRKNIKKLLSIGHHKVEDPMLKLRLLAFNGTILAVVSVCLLVLAIYLGFGYFDRLPSLMPWLILFPLLMILVHRGHFLLARVGFMLLAWSGISVGVYLFGRSGMVGLYCLPAAFFPFVLFTGREWRWISFFSLSSLLLFVCIQLLFHIPASYPLPQPLSEASAVLHTSAAFIMAVLPFTLLFFQSEFFHREILRKTEERVHAERMADLGRIAAGTAHEVNNPLTIVHFVLQLLEQDELLRHRPDRIERIHKGFEAIERIKKIVERLLSLSQSPMDAYESIRLGDFPEIIRHLFAEHMRDGGIRFEILQQGLDEVVIFGQKGRILEILINLLSNAMDAVRGHKDPWIQISFRRETGQFTVLVHDSGPGVPPEKSERIFTPFYTTKEIGKGTGLGLSSSRSIARHHGGDLLCLPGPGGQFLLTLPLLYQPADLVPAAS